jgi:hypothetical protein
MLRTITKPVKKNMSLEFQDEICRKKTSNPCIASDDEVVVNEDRF